MKRLFSFFFKKTDLKRRSNSVFKFVDFFYDKKILIELETKGFTVIDCLESKKLQILQKNVSLFLKEISLEDVFFTSGRAEKFIMKRAKDLTIPLLDEEFKTIFDSERAAIDGGALLIKPTGNKSELSPHQDSSLVDETKYSMCYGWIPIQDVTRENGCVYVIPGSHLWGNHYRSLDVPWIFDNVKDILFENAIPVEMKAGQLLLFDSALIHGSFINSSPEPRIAINIVVKNKSIELMHYRVGNDTPKGKIESYKVDMDFFFEHNYRLKPNQLLYPFQGYVCKLTPYISLKTIKQLFEK